MRTLLILFLMILNISVVAGDCKKLEWTKETSRTQGGGFIWFPGIAVKIRQLDTAILLAEGRALDYLIGECKAPHKEIQFHERCIEEDGPNFTVYVRASIKQKFCDEAKYSKDLGESYSWTLDTKLFEYYKLINREVTTDVCSNDVDACLALAESAELNGNKTLALKYLEKACNSRLEFGCGAYGDVLINMGFVQKGHQFLKSNCNLGDEYSCFLLKQNKL